MLRRTFVTIMLGCGILMGYFWLMRFPAGPLVLAALSCAIPVAPELADTSGVPVAPLVTVVGAPCAVTAVLLGDGIIVKSEILCLHLQCA